MSRWLFSCAKLYNPVVGKPYSADDRIPIAVPDFNAGAGNTRKALLLITDGEDDYSRYSFSNIKEFARERDVQTFAIGIVNNLLPNPARGQVGPAKT